MNTLLIEILACLFAAAFLSLFVGWAIRSVLANKEVKSTNAAWESKHSELELRYKQDTEHLDEQVDRLEAERDQLNAQNSSISESLRENEIGVHKARADAIELNRQQAETQERLQRIIAQKDEELKMIRNGSSPAIGVSAIAGAPTMDDGTTEAKIATLSAKREAWERERQRLVNNFGDEQQTIALDPADVPLESFDKTVRVSPEYVDELRNKTTERANLSEPDADKTLTLDNDQTIVLDNNNLNSPDTIRPTFEKPRPGGSPRDIPSDNDD